MTGNASLTEVITWAEGFKDVGTVSTLLAHLQELQRLKAAVARVEAMTDNAPPLSHAPAHWQANEACAWADGYASGLLAVFRTLTAEEACMTNLPRS